MDTTNENTLIQIFDTLIEVLDCHHFDLIKTLYNTNHRFRSCMQTRMTVNQIQEKIFKKIKTIEEFMETHEMAMDAHQAFSTHTQSIEFEFILGKYCALTKTDDPHHMTLSNGNVYIPACILRFDIHCHSKVYLIFLDEDGGVYSDPHYDHTELDNIVDDYCKYYLPIFQTKRLRRLQWLRKSDLRMFNGMTMDAVLNVINDLTIDFSHKI